METPVENIAPAPIPEPAPAPKPKPIKVKPVPPPPAPEPDYSKYTQNVGKVFQLNERKVTVVDFYPRYAHGEGFSPHYKLEPVQTVECDAFLALWKGE